MTVNLMQVDRHGKENITALFQSEEEREFMTWLYSLEKAAPGVTIFVHRLSDPGHYLCTVPCPYSRLANDPRLTAQRFCGCLDCIDQRSFLKDYTARLIISNMRELIPPELAAEIMEGSTDVLNR